jgi:hypothetical protein
MSNWTHLFVALMHLVRMLPCFQGFEAYVGVLLLQTALHGLASEWQARMIQQLSLLTVECQIGLKKIL